MEAKKITAIIRCTCLEAVEGRLRELGVKGMSVTHVKGLGEYANFFTRDWLTDHTRIEIFTSQEKADAIVAAIMECANTGARGDGIVAVLPVDKVYRIRERADCTESL